VTQVGEIAYLLIFVYVAFCLNPLPIEYIMPEISRFYGIVIFMNYNNHLPPHFHAKYQGYEVTVSIEDGEVTGSMSKRALNLIYDWQEKIKPNCWKTGR
jgi:hypothetical protein